MKIAARVIGVILLIAAAGLAAARLGVLDSDPAEAATLYGSAPSRFLDIDGSRLHYRDEGEGPVIVLLHGSRGSLQQWDGWVRELGGRFRVVRLDGPAHGLSGPDGRGDYGAARGVLLLDRLLERLGIERFVLVGTSSGATEAVRYAAAHPEKVQKLILSTVPLKLPAQSRMTAADRFVFWFHDTILGSEATELYWRTFLRSVFGDPGKVTPEMVRRYRILNNLPGQQQRFRQRIAVWRREGGPERDYALAAKITAPTFIQWGAAGPVLPQALFCSIAGAFSSTSVRMKVYPELGHMLVMEDPVGTVRDALAFIADGAGAPPACASAPAAAVERSAASVAASSR